MKKNLSAHEERQIAVLAEVDPKTVRRALDDPDSVRGLSLTRIERALHKRGLDHLLPHGRDEE